MILPSLLIAFSGHPYRFKLRLARFHGSIGTVALGVFSQSYLRHRATEAWLTLLFVAAGALVLVLHGGELDGEQVLHKIAGYLLIHCA